MRQWLNITLSAFDAVGEGGNDDHQVQVMVLADGSYSVDPCCDISNQPGPEPDCTFDRFRKPEPTGWSLAPMARAQFRRDGPDLLTG